MDDWKQLKLNDDEKEALFKTTNSIYDYLPTQYH